MTKLLRTLCLGLTLAIAPAGAMAAGGAPVPFHYSPDPSNLASLQRGARNYMAYCAACHSMKHLRFSRLSQDLGIPMELVQQYLMHNTDKPGDVIKAGMPEESVEWFGQKPPDLSLTTRARTPSWVYSYLMTFYLDPSRPLGVNNLVLAGASMPHVLWELQGWQALDPEHAANGSGHGGAHTGLKLVSAGTLSPAEYERFVADTVNFMAYAAEPGRAARQSLGIKVMAFLLVFTLLAWLLKREYWRDVH